MRNALSLNVHVLKELQPLLSQFGFRIRKVSSDDDYKQSVAFVHKVDKDALSKPHFVLENYRWVDSTPPVIGVVYGDDFTVMPTEEAEKLPAGQVSIIGCQQVVVLLEHLFKNEYLFAQNSPIVGYGYAINNPETSPTTTLMFPETILKHLADVYGVVWSGGDSTQILSTCKENEVASYLSMVSLYTKFRKNLRKSEAPLIDDVHSQLPYFMSALPHGIGTDLLYRVRDSSYPTTMASVIAPKLDFPTVVLNALTTSSTESSNILMGKTMDRWIHDALIEHGKIKLSNEIFILGKELSHISISGEFLPLPIVFTNKDAWDATLGEIVHMTKDPLELVVKLSLIRFLLHFAWRSYHQLLISSVLDTEVGFDNIRTLYLTAVNIAYMPLKISLHTLPL